MTSTQAVFAIIIGLVVASFPNASAKDASPVKASSSAAVKPGNKNHPMLAPLADNYLYTMFACRNKKNGLRLPITGSCVDYFECQQGKAVRKTCPEGFQFSNHGLACLDSRISKCRPEQFEIACEGPCCTREDGLYPAEDSCSNFYICISGHSYYRTCGDILQFDSQNLICDIPERARCGAIIEKELVEAETGGDVPKGEEASSRPAMYMISHRVCKDKPDGHSIAIPGSCNKFYMCVAGLGYLKSCGRMQFNPAKHYCDLRTRMYCPENDDDEVILEDDKDLLTDLMPQVDPLPAKKKPEIVKKPAEVDAENTNELEKEQTGKKPAKKPQAPEEPTDLEENELIDPVRPGARPSFPKQSEEDDLPSEDIAAPSNRNVCADQPVGALMPMTGECAKYIRCRWDWYERRTAEVLTCPDDMHFNPKTKYCDRPENVNCKTSSEGAQAGRTLKKNKSQKYQKGN